VLYAFDPRRVAILIERNQTMAEKFAKLRAQMSPAARRKAAARAEALTREMPLHELRAARKLSQEALAAALRTGQSSISRLEKRTDMYVSTLRSYVEALGGELEITARFRDGVVRISQFGEIGG
jgi:DNA-binding transcriptional regulator YiaG